MTCDDTCCQIEPSWLKIDKNKGGVLGGQFHIKKLPDRFLEKKKNLHSLQTKFNYHKNNLSLTYHLKVQHPTKTISAGPHQSTLQKFGTRGWITKPVSEKPGY